MMQRKLVRFDEQRRVRVDLDQDGIRRTGQALIAAIDQVTAVDPRWAETLLPLREYASAGIAGGITTPRTWSDEPLRYEFREFLLPDPVAAAYGHFAFRTHGTISGPLTVRHQNGVAYVEVDD